MKRFLLLCTLLLSSPIWAAVGGWDVNARPNSDWFSANQSFRNIPLHWMRAADSLIGSGAIGATGTGTNRYVDSGVTTTGGDGLSWRQADTTVEAAINASAASAGDWIHVAEGHAGSSTTAADIYTADKAGITIYHHGSPGQQGAYTFGHADTTMTISAPNVTVIGGRYLAGITAVVAGFTVTATGDFFTLREFTQPEPTTASWEFIDFVQLTTAGNDVSILYGVGYNRDQTGAAHWINGGAGVIERLTVVGNRVHMEATGGIIFSDQADLEGYFANNYLFNETTGQLGIQMTGAATGTAINNLVVADTLGSGYDFGSMRPFGNLQQLDALDSSPIDVPLIQGKSYSLSKAATIQTDTLFDIQNGPILVTSFWGLVTTAFEAQANNLSIIFNADSGWVDYDLSTAVETNGDLAGDRITFTAANESVLTPLTGPNGGATELFDSWLVGEGMLEQLASASGTGGITWYITFIPLGANIVVVPQ